MQKTIHVNYFLQVLLSCHASITGSEEAVGVAWFTIVFVAEGLCVLFTIEETFSHGSLAVAAFIFSHGNFEQWTFELDFSHDGLRWCGLDSPRLAK